MQFLHRSVRLIGMVVKGIGGGEEALKEMMVNAMVARYRATAEHFQIEEAEAKKNENLIRTLFEGVREVTVLCESASGREAPHEIKEKIISEGEDIICGADAQIVTHRNNRTEEQVREDPISLVPLMQVEELAGVGVLGFGWPEACSENQTDDFRFEMLVINK